MSCLKILVWAKIKQLLQVPALRFRCEIYLQVQNYALELVRIAKEG